LRLALSKRAFKSFWITPTTGGLISSQLSLSSSHDSLKYLQKLMTVKLPSISQFAHWSHQWLPTDC